MILRCKLCGADTIRLGTKTGKLSKRDFHFYGCSACRFAFVGDPRTDYQEVYSEDYYRGRGADPYVDFVYESQHPATTIRNYEWRGILANIQALTTIRPETRWLDFGCGQGGLLKFCYSRVPAKYFGFEEGWLNPAVAELPFPIIRRQDLIKREGPFNIITAIEVLEHIENPAPTLTLIRQLLKKGGIFFYTTGNPLPHWNRFVQWEYAYPEIHLSYFSPTAMAKALTKAGFCVKTVSHFPGYSDIIRYKVLKRLGLKDQHWIEKMLPWSLISKAIDSSLRITGYPIGTS
jgi:2-polyprenyl-3-methyl-5-hydroxy-6-metoxy-1,4-benzoquinol methylase